jgi:hypothetical protein
MPNAQSDGSDVDHGPCNSGQCSNRLREPNADHHKLRQQQADHQRQDIHSEHNHSDEQNGSDNSEAEESTLPQMPGCFSRVGVRQPADGVRDETEIAQTDSRPHAKANPPFGPTEQQEKSSPGCAHHEGARQGPMDKTLSLVQTGNGERSVAKASPTKTSPQRQSQGKRLKLTR